MSKKPRTLTNTFKSLFNPNIQTEEEGLREEENKIRQEILEEKRKSTLRERSVDDLLGEEFGESKEINNSNISDSKITVNKSNTVKVLKPLTKDDAYIVINHLKNRRVIFVMLNELDINVSRDILDIITGALHFADFKIEEVQTGQFLIDPSYKG